MVRAGNNRHPPPTLNPRFSCTSIDSVCDAVVCCLTSIGIEWAYDRNWLRIRTHFVMWSTDESDADRRGDDREQKDLHSAAINGILSGLVSITAGE